MKFLYRYQDRSGRLAEGVLSAPSEADAYSLLRKSGIRPMKVWPAPGWLNRLAFLGKRGYAIVVLTAVLLAVLALGRSPRDRHDPARAASVTIPTALAPLPRQQLAAVDVAFDFPADAALAAFARPGDISALTDGFPPASALDGLREALDAPLALGPHDAPEAVLLKRIVAGIREECRMALDNGDAPADVFAHLLARQRMEAAYRDGLLRDVNAVRDSAARARRRDEANALLLSMGMRALD